MKTGAMGSRGIRAPVAIVNLHIHDYLWIHLHTILWSCFFCTRNEKVIFSQQYFPHDHTRANTVYYISW